MATDQTPNMGVQLHVHVCDYDISDLIVGQDVDGHMTFYCLACKSDWPEDEAPYDVVGEVLAAIRAKYPTLMVERNE
jgi:hypothetical protein